MLEAHIDMTKNNMLWCGADGSVIITLLCIHLTNIVQFINKSLCFFTFRLEGVGGWSVLEERHYV